MVKVVAVIQARLSSSRLPGKVMLDLGGKTLLERVVDRVKEATKVDEIVIATSKNEEDMLIEKLAKMIGVRCIRGSLENVFSRFKQAILETDADIVVRVTADNPLTNTVLIDLGVQYLRLQSLDYLGFKKVPVGSAVEVFTANAFLAMDEKQLDEHNREHVTSYFYRHEEKYKIQYIDNFFEEDMSHISVTVDTLEDYIKVAQYFLKEQ